MGIVDNLEGIQTTFQEIHNLILMCKYPDCKHINEKGCAVLDAMEKGTINKASLENYQKMLREQDRFQSTVAAQELNR